MTDQLTPISKFLAYVLRHRPEAVGITLDEGGWIDLDILVAALARHGRTITPGLLDRLIAGTDKRRFEIRDGRIRAAQGHSLRVDLQLEPATPPPLLYHGTVARFLTSITAHGLQPRTRTHVHLSADTQTAATIGARRGEPIILTIDAAGMHDHGFTFYRASNGVWLTSHVPPEWISRSG